LTVEESASIIALMGVFVRLRARAVVAAALLGWGCGYSSQYVPPVDGRVRAVWREDNVVTSVPPFVIGDACERQLADLLVGATPPADAAPRTVWTPRYYGPDILVVVPGVAPTLPAPPIFLSPSMMIAAAAARSARPPSTTVSAPGVPRLHDKAPDGAGAFLIALGVIALLVMPALDLGLALDVPESQSRSSEAIDRVNAYNDLARTPGSACAP
jgi:hypothetical protein